MYKVYKQKALLRLHRKFTSHWLISDVSFFSSKNRVINLTMAVTGETIGSSSSVSDMMADLQLPLFQLSLTVFHRLICYYCSTSMLIFNLLILTYQTWYCSWTLLERTKWWSLIDFTCMFSFLFCCHVPRFAPSFWCNSLMTITSVKCFSLLLIGNCIKLLMTLCR